MDDTTRWGVSAGVGVLGSTSDPTVLSPGPVDALSLHSPPHPRPSPVSDGESTSGVVGPSFSHRSVRHTHTEVESLGAKGVDSGPLPGQGWDVPVTPRCRTDVCLP